MSDPSDATEGSRSADAPPFDVVLFDLDGTLTDPAIGITSSYRHALAAVGRHAADDADLTWVIGPPIQENLALLGVTAEELPLAVGAYRGRHGEVGLYEAEVVPGIPELLGRLRSAGVRLALATAKPTGEGARTLEHFGLSEHFAVVSGNRPDGSLTKADVVAAALRELGGPDPGRAAMVGDRRHDVHGAATHGLTSVGVRWGFASVDELEEAGAQHVVTTVDELGAVLGLAGEHPPSSSAHRPGPRRTGHDRAGGPP
ncbi:HAD hydrolase-like protein [Cellulomonas fimi]|uniref:HAD hydrolase-like protein n=1 Tax=Cellulomonas fimi TaxID=1708 RepID=A0A7Y0M1C7_CELFI|nr:HAD hydrolase-like protein [Cellulomonas fimi]